MKRDNRKSRLIVTNLAVAMPLREAMDNYIYAFSGNVNTRRAKQQDCESFIEFAQLDLNEQSVWREPLLADVSAGMIQKWCRKLYGEHAPSTVARMLATIKHLCRIASEDCEDFRNPARNIKGPRIDDPLPKSLSAKELARVRLVSRSIGITEHARMRNHAIIELAFATGLRCAELCDLQIGQLPPSRDCLRLVKGKGQTFKTVPLNDRATAAIDEWLSVREDMLTTHDHRYPFQSQQTKDRYPIFISGHRATPGAPLTYRMSEKSIWRIFQQAGTLAKLTFQLHPHMARHTFARRYYEASGKDILSTREAMRHANVNTTARYAKPTEAEVRKVYQHI